MPHPTHAAVLTALALAAAPAAQALTLEKATDVAGAGRSFSLYQPSLALTPLVVTNASFEGLGEVVWFAGGFAPGGTMEARGQLLDIRSHTALYARLGNAYGGDGVTTFRLPDLRGRAAAGRAASGPRTLGSTFGAPSLALTPDTMPTHGHALPGGGATAPAGGGQGVDVTMPSLTLSYSTSFVGTFPTPRSTLPNPTLGFAQISAAASDPVPTGAAELQGQFLPIAQNDALFSILGTVYGGDGRTTFGLPDLSDAIPVHETPQERLGGRFGSPVGDPSFAPLPEHAHELEDGGLSEVAGVEPTPFDIRQESLSMTWLISLVGVFPPVGGGAYDLGAPYLGEVRPFLGGFAPRGWAFADGRLLPISQNEALFSILGTVYGGDGRTSFGLPDLRGRTPIGRGQGADLPNFFLGQRTGEDVVSLTLDELPRHGHGYRVDAPPVPLPGAALLLIGALAGLGVAARPRGRA